MLEKLQTELKLRGFTPITIKTYLRHNQKFLDFIKKDPEEIKGDDVKTFMAHLISEKNCKPATVNLNLSALKFFYEGILKKKIFADIKSQKSEKKLPTVLTKEEIKGLLGATRNQKHRLLIEFLYSSGLRVSEVVRIRVDDLDLNEKMGLVKSGKGKKDRNIIISESLIEHLGRYLRKRKQKSEYVFPGQIHGEPLSIRMAQRIVSNSAKKAGIKKRVFCHALRSSFATHLLESGVDIRYIQSLLGHSNLSTTEIYTKVSTEQLKKIKSPLDDL